MTDFGIQPPTAIFGRLKTGDEVKVNFELTVGEDFSIGYLEHSRDSVTLYLQESMTFRVLAPEAAVPLRYAR